MKYRKKSITINAFQWNGSLKQLVDNVDEKDRHRFTRTFQEANVPVIYNLKQMYKENHNTVLDGIYIYNYKSSEHYIRARKNDYLIKDDLCNYFIMHPNAFKKIFEKVE